MTSKKTNSYHQEKEPSVCCSDEAYDPSLARYHCRRGLFTRGFYAFKTHLITQTQQQHMLENAPNHNDKRLGCVHTALQIAIVASLLAWYRFSCVMPLFALIDSASSRKSASVAARDSDDVVTQRHTTYTSTRANALESCAPTNPPTHASLGHAETHLRT